MFACHFQTFLPPGWNVCLGGVPQDSSYVLPGSPKRSPGFFLGGFSTFNHVNLFLTRLGAPNKSFNLEVLKVLDPWDLFCFSKLSN